MNEKTIRKSCVIYDSWADQILNLPDDMAGKYVKSILKYAMYGEDEESDNTFINAMLVPVRKKLDEDLKKYQEQVDRMNKNRSQKEVSMKSERSHDEVASDTVTDTVTVTDYKKKKYKKKNSFDNFTSRGYDYQALEKEVLNV